VAHAALDITTAMAAAIERWRRAKITGRERSSPVLRTQVTIWSVWWRRAGWPAASADRCTVGNFWQLIADVPTTAV
jgi:hypothetical protein